MNKVTNHSLNTLNYAMAHGSLFDWTIARCRETAGLRAFKDRTIGSCACAPAFGTQMPPFLPTRVSEQRTYDDPTFETARTAHGLPQHMSDGVILHAWEWSFDTIREHLDDIAAAGYTSIQTVPASAIYRRKADDPEVYGNNRRFEGNWYSVYEPIDTTFGNDIVGDAEAFQKLTVEAHKRGLRIIVDAVTNHMVGAWGEVTPAWRDEALYHNASNTPTIRYSNRWQVTHRDLMNLRDLNTESLEVAERMQRYTCTVVKLGADGFRFDAAKHIELPYEFAHSVFWEHVLDNGAQFQYGEVLQGDFGLDARAYADMFSAASSDGGAITASSYGYIVREAIEDEDLSASRLQQWWADGVQANQMVTWVESHDTYANGDKESTWLTDDQIRVGWAIISARAAGAPLFFNRPKASGGAHGVQFAEVSELGESGDDMWHDPVVVALNQFHNHMIGARETLRNPVSNSGNATKQADSAAGSDLIGDGLDAAASTNSQCLLIERTFDHRDDSAATDHASQSNISGARKHSGGIVAINIANTAVDLTGTLTDLPDGMYVNAVETNHGDGSSCHVLQVKDGVITSGTVGVNAIAVFE